MAFIGTPLDTRNTFQSLVGKRFNGDGSTTDFTLDVAPGNVLDIEVFVGNVRQDPNSAYTLSGTTLTFTGAPPSGTNNIYVVHQAKSVGTIGIPDDTISARTLVTADSSADHVIIEDATDGELKKALYPSGFDVSSITGATALAAQPAADDEIVLSDAGTLKRLDIKHIQNTPAFHAYLGSNQTVANNTVTRINFNTELFDSDGCYDNSTNYRFTPGVAGKYFLYYQMKNNNQTDYIYSRIRKNNSDIQIETHYTGADVDDFARGFTIVDSDADDYFDIHLQQTKGSDQTVSSGAQNTFFGGFRIAGV
jgi:hypothetical protein